MKKQTIVNVLSKGFIIISSLSLLSVSLMAFVNPQSVMDLVNVKLTNVDAYSSIRGIYGGAGLTIFITLIYLLRNNISLGLIFLILLWGFYALSRTITIFVEGKLGSFGTQWLITESALCLIGIVLYQLRTNLIMIKEV